MWVGRLLVYCWVGSAALVGVAGADDLPDEKPVPGGILVVPLPESATEVYYGGNRALVTRRHAVIGVPLEAGSAEVWLEVRHRDGSVSRRSRSLTTHSYPEQRLRITDKKRADPDPESIERILREQRLIREGFSGWIAMPGEADLSLMWPVRGPVSSEFGLRRFINDTARSPHGGLDIAAPEGTPVLAAAAGRVILDEEFFLNGNSVMIDHGQGLKTFYCHLLSSRVQVGQSVAKGEEIGTVGKTGRVTGAHLHWAVSLNDARVDPRLLLPVNGR